MIGEPGIEATPWADPAQTGSEEDLDHPRGAEELTQALMSTWAIVDRCLDRWTPGMLNETVGVESAGGVRLYTRQSILLRLLSHDAYHVVSSPETPASRAFLYIDLWPREDHALRARRSSPDRAQLR